MRLPDLSKPIVKEKRIFSIENENSLSEIESDLELSIIGETVLDSSFPPKFLLKGNLKFSISGECVKCLKKITLPVSSDFSSIIDITANTIEAEDLEAPPEEGLFTFISPDEIDITNELIERTYLSIPNFIYCKSDCKGLCSVCGCDLNVESCDCIKNSGSGHFDKLRTLLEEKK